MPKEGEKELCEESNKCVRGCCTSSSIPLTIPHPSFSLLSPISRGSESVVYEAILEGIKVAAKRPILSTTNDIDRFHKELQILCTLNHPSITNLVAAHAKPPNYMFLFPFYENGSLAQALHVNDWRPPSAETILRLASQLASALQYLHKFGIIHRDVKPANILLDTRLGAHVADFGLAEYAKDLGRTTAQNWKSTGKPTGGFHKKNMVGTLIYMAPEVLRKEIHSEKSDIYSFAITINELITGVVPYTDLRTEAQAHTVLEMNYSEQQLTAAITSDGLRPALADSESGIPSDLLSLIELCWSGNPQDRPSSDMLVKKLEDITLDYNKREKGSTIFNEALESTDTTPTNINTDHHNPEDVSWSHQGAVSTRGLNPSASLNNWLSLAAIQDTYFPTLSWGSFATCGRRETMEDTHFFSPCLGGQSHIFACGVFDGHRGAAAAQFSVNAMPRILHSASSVESPSEVLANAFIKTDLLFRKELDKQGAESKGKIKVGHPGCTASVALIVENRLFVANAGDCRTILCRKGCPIALSKDHVASSTEERNRVVGAGGEVKWQIDTWRVGAAALQVTRSIGDDDLKPAVTAEPEIMETLVSPDDEYLVMASDGLWDTLSNEDVISLIKDTVKEPSMCSKRLATEAVERGSNDNITVIVVFLRLVSTVERIY